MPQPLTLLIDAGYPIILIATPDETHAAVQVAKAASLLARPLYDWSLTTGLVTRLPNSAPAAIPAGSAKAALEHIRKVGGNGLYLFRDLAPHLKDPIVERLLRDFYASTDRFGPTILTLETGEVPESLRRLSVSYDIKPPDLEELEQIVRGTFTRLTRESLYETTAGLTQSQFDQLVRTLCGLSRAEAARVVATAVLDDHVLDAADLPRIVEAKRMLLGSRGVLETIGVDFTIDDVGGLGNLKQWLAQRRGACTKKAREFGLESPRGMLLLGVQGCGKSLCAKAVAADWNWPLLRLDPGVLYQRFVGESERTLRDALDQAEAMAPVVLWIDEIEKAFASQNAALSDGGLSQRMFGTFLSWLQDHRYPIFTVATANDVSALPPELLRKGRFDEVFFVDLPDTAAREKILSVHLQRRKRDARNFNLPKLAAACEGFSGAEIEQLTVAALFDAFAGKQELTDEHLLQAATKTKPLAVLARERIADLREWAKDRCVAADG
jgi:AAA+ superfamily predicted ATPase